LLEVVGAWTVTEPLNDAVPDTVAFPPMNTLFDTPTPPFTMTAPVDAPVVSVVELTVTEFSAVDPLTVRFIPTVTVLAIPMPPDKMTDPVEMLVESTVLTHVMGPVVTLPVTPSPPLIKTAPVVTLVDAVVLVTLNIPVNVTGPSVEFDDTVNAVAVTVPI
jgi:hypothetical protein